MQKQKLRSCFYFYGGEAEALLEMVKLAEEDEDEDEEDEDDAWWPLSKDSA
jgi:hypothetical protein